MTSVIKKNGKRENFQIHMGPRIVAEKDLVEVESNTNIFCFKCSKKGILIFQNFPTIFMRKVVTEGESFPPYTQS